ncbi:MAG: HupE/UreJ family protein [Polyangiaceae bacterium]|nr:HupE/UreJ family protein [Polyangiaceae bacterium]
MSGRAGPALRIAPFAAASLAMLLAAGEARAHDFSPGVLVFVERADGAYDTAWTEPVDSIGAPAGVHVSLPEGCRFDAPTLVACGDRGLHGTLRFEGMHASRMQVVVSVQHRDGRRFERIVTGDDPQIEIESSGGALASWVRLGIEHIVSGIDHLAFVAGLILLTGFRRRLLWTLTAFTLAHSITLGLAASKLVTLPSAPVEAAIAISIVLVAREALSDRPSLARRAPWLVAFVFGLVHGLGFAGALADVGLPREGFALALAGFNIGVEIGQLGAVAIAFVAMIALRPLIAKYEKSKLAACYALGALGAWWFLARLLALLQTA